MSTEDKADEAPLALPGIAGRVALVTGGARGIGAEIAATLQRQGASLAVADLEAPVLDGALGVAMDVTEERSVAAGFARVEDELGSVSMVVANAGICPLGGVAETSLETWEQTLRVNLTGAFLTFRQAIPAMREAGFGRIVAIGSSAGRNGGKTQPFAAYAASKGGVHTLIKALAQELARTGITANAVLPAVIETEMNRGRDDLARHLLVTRAGRPSDIAGAVCFFCSEAGAYITGELLDVNGGFLVD